MPQPTLPLRDTARVYGKISRALHWGLAALLLWQFFGMGLKLATGWKPSESAILATHSPLGVVIFALMVVRVAWAVANAGNRPDHGTGALAWAAKAGHGLLYVAFLVVPVLALLRAWGNTRPFSVWGVEIFAPREVEVEWAVALGNMFHGELAWVSALLIFGHIVMVGVHSAMWKDGTLSKMAGRKGLG